eukprot:SAG31_NODE_19746_length_592_cov_2.277890_2_plen_128_part_01
MLHRTLTDTSAVHEVVLETTSLFVDTAGDSTHATVGGAFSSSSRTEFGLSAGGSLDAFAAGVATSSAEQIGIASGGDCDLTAQFLGVAEADKISVSTQDMIERAACGADVAVDDTLQVFPAGPIRVHS